MLYTTKAVRSWNNSNSNDYCTTKSTQRGHTLLVSGHCYADFSLWQRETLWLLAIVDIQWTGCHNELIKLLLHLSFLYYWISKSFIQLKVCLSSIIIISLYKAVYWPYFTTRWSSSVRTHSYRLSHKTKQQSTHENVAVTCQRNQLKSLYMGYQVVTLTFQTYLVLIIWNIRLSWQMRKFRNVLIRYSICLYARFVNYTYICNYRDIIDIYVALNNYKKIKATKKLIFWY